MAYSKYEPVDGKDLLEGSVVSKNEKTYPRIICKTVKRYNGDFLPC